MWTGAGNARWESNVGVVTQKPGPTFLDAGAE